jgi:hypothetical protein
MVGLSTGCDLDLREETKIGNSPVRQRSEMDRGKMQGQVTDERRFQSTIVRHNRNCVFKEIRDSFVPCPGLPGLISCCPALKRWAIVNANMRDNQNNRQEPLIIGILRTLGHG